MQPREREYTPSDFDIPADGYGAGYCEHKFREALADLVGIYGRENAKQIASEMVEEQTRRPQ